MAKKKFKMPPEEEKIDCKSAAYHLFQTGQLGNGPRRWSSLGDLYADDYRGLVTVRYAVAGTKFTAAHIPFDEVPARVAGWIKQGAQESLFRPNESLPDQALAIQGEFIYKDPLGANLRYSTEKGLSMRQAMEKPLYATGLRAKELLKHYFDPNSLEAFHALMERFPSAAIEFACYEKFVGVIPRRNVIFFEARTNW
jgi:hypothetical protein